MVLVASLVKIIQHSPTKFLKRLSVRCCNVHFWMKCSSLLLSSKIKSQINSQFQIGVRRQEVLICVFMISFHFHCNISTIFSKSVNEKCCNSQKMISRLALFKWLETLTNPKCVWIYIKWILMNVKMHLLKYDSTFSYTKKASIKFGVAIVPWWQDWHSQRWF